MSFRIEHVEHLPQNIEDGVVYVSEEYEIAALKCACGCGHKITLLVGDGHEVRDLGGLADIWPSIGVWDAPCRSHFFVKNGEVRWAGRWSEDEIKHAMERQLERHVASTKKVPWYTKLWKGLISWFR